MELHYSVKLLPLQVKVRLASQLKSLKKSVALLKNVNKFYGEGSVKVKALNELNLEVFQGDYLAVMGASGSGKSTAMNILGCLDRPTNGTYELNGTAVEKFDDDLLADIRNKELGFVFQQFHLLQEVSALENVMLPMIYACVPSLEREKRAEEALNRVGLGNRMTNLPNQLSGGQQQRVAIARAIINQPSLLLADEPTGALDSKTTEDVLNLFDQLHSQGITIVLVTHEDNVAQRAKKIARFRDGKVIEITHN